MQHTHLGKYKVLSVIGKGGMGLVYRGYDETIERDVAIKIVHPHLIGDEDREAFLQRFINEAKAAARCNHPNIVTILEYGEDQNTPYLVMEYVKGFSLHEYLTVHKKVPIKKTLNTVVQVLKALHFAHQQGIVHRDIKPANILLLPDNHVKITDFGIARLPYSELTQIGFVLGSPYYMSPEQAFAEQADHRADLFSVGVILAQLLTQSIYSNVTTSKLEKIQGLPPKIRVDFSSAYPNALVPLLQKSLQAKPELRFQSAKEFIEALRDSCHRANTDMSHNMTSMTAISPIAQNNILEAQLVEIKKQLSDHIGPIADKLIQIEMAKTNDLMTLIKRLLVHVPSGSERHTFETQMTRMCDTVAAVPAEPTQIIKQPVSNPDSAISMDSQTINALCHDYSEHVGPLATRMVKKALQKYTSKTQLLDYLAENIPNTEERNDFLNHWRNLI